jgi:lysophospholipase L1-like esterase
MVFFSKAAYMASHGDLKPVRTLYQTLVFGMTLPMSAIAYQVSGGSILVTITAAITLPMAVILQGSVGIIRYRLYYGDAPIPIAPSHGVVICGEAITPSSNCLHRSSSIPSLDNPMHMKRTQSFALSAGCQHETNNAESTCCEKKNAATTSYGSTTSMTTLNGIHSDIGTNDARQPIRLLVIGDSLAIGVGQVRNCTPVMPEAIAKTISSRFAGRVVYWTCHGSPGASTGWIVRELERGVKQEEMNEESGYDDDEDEDDDYDKVNIRRDDKGQIVQTCSDTDESSYSDESATIISPPPKSSSISETMNAAAKMKQQRKVWRERLAQHRKCFDPEVLGPYDIVVVMTGGNDLKSAFFPFLLTGEDAEFRRQAKARGGNYTKELRQLLQALNRDLRTKLRNIRYSVEAAAETVIEKVEQNMELIAKSSSSPTARRMSGSISNLREKFISRKDLEGLDELTTQTEQCNGSQQDKRLQNRYPMVVLPGLPSRALPIFRLPPLNWIAVPIVDILDMHKRRLAKLHPGEVMFVPPPSINDVVEYESCNGEIWHQRCYENPKLILRDVRRYDCRRVENELRRYYNLRDKRQSTGEGLKKEMAATWFSSFFSQKSYGEGIFSIDQVHPNDDGYDFLGRYIGNAISEEWIKHPDRYPP